MPLQQNEEPNMIWWILGTVFLFVGFLGYCSCIMAGRADDQMEEWIKGKEIRSPLPLQLPRPDLRVVSSREASA